MSKVTSCNQLFAAVNDLLSMKIMSLRYRCWFGSSRFEFAGLLLLDIVGKI
jgi:hypothetical protein